MGEVVGSRNNYANNWVYLDGWREFYLQWYIKDPMCEVRGPSNRPFGGSRQNKRQ